MVFGENPLKDAYRLAVWGPYRKALEAAPDGVELAANRALGRLACKAMPRRRELIRSHLRDALGEHPDLDRWTRETFETHFTNQYVGITFAKVGADNWDDYLRFVGKSHLDDALASGKGVVVAHPHTALPQLPLHVLGLQGYDVHQVGGGVTHVELSRVGRKVADLRASLESRIAAKLHDGKQYVRPLLRVLKAGGVVFTACDGTGGGDELGRREVFDVLGRRMKLPVFATWLAEKSGATVITLHTTRDRLNDAKYVAELGPPVDGMPEIAARMGRWLRHSPGDWHFWDAWQTGPHGLLSDD
jgi:lauroyl/myristoyl acyltransferase